MEEGERERPLSRFITPYREGARPMRNCLCPCPALLDASGYARRIPTTYARRSNVLGNGASCVPRAPCRCCPPTLLHLCFSVRTKIINGKGPGPGTGPKCQCLDNDEVCTSGPSPDSASSATRGKRRSALARHLRPSVVGIIYWILRLKGEAGLKFGKRGSDGNV